MMPYIKPELRDKTPQNAGMLNYRLTRLLLWYLKAKGESYQTYNDIIGVLECAKLELYRRKVQHYENQKCRENGDVF